MKTVVFVTTSILITTISANAQGFGGLTGKARSLTGKNGGDSAAGDTAAVLSRGNALLGYVTAATDQGIIAVEKLIAIYPPEKVQAISEAAAKYNEISSKTPDQNLDAEAIKVASQVAEEAAKLEGDWKGYEKEDALAVRQANARLGLVLLADAQAGTQVPDMLKALQNTTHALQSDPMQAAKPNIALSMVSVLTAVAKEFPQQTRSFSTVRSLTKKIAEAENFQLAKDPTPDQVLDKTSLSAASKVLSD